MLGQGQARVKWQVHTEFKTLTAHSVTDKAVIYQKLIEARQQGWAVSEQQIELQYRGIALPVRDARGNVQAALSVTTAMAGESAGQARQRVWGVLSETAVAIRNLI